MLPSDTLHVQNFLCDAVHAGKLWALCDTISTCKTLSEIFKQSNNHVLHHNAGIPNYMYGIPKSKMANGSHRMWENVLLSDIFQHFVYTQYNSNHMFISGAWLFFIELCWIVKVKKITFHSKTLSKPWAWCFKVGLNRINSVILLAVLVLFQIITNHIKFYYFTYSQLVCIFSNIINFTF